MAQMTISSAYINHNEEQKDVKCLAFPVEWIFVPSRVFYYLLPNYCISFVVITHNCFLAFRLVC